MQEVSVNPRGRRDRRPTRKLPPKGLSNEGYPNNSRSGCNKNVTVKTMVEAGSRIRVLESTEPKTKSYKCFQIDPEFPFICPFSVEADYICIRLCRLTEYHDEKVHYPGVGCPRRLCENSGHQQSNLYRRNTWRLRR